MFGFRFPPRIISTFVVVVEAFVVVDVAVEEELLLLLLLVPVTVDVESVTGWMTVEVSVDVVDGDDVDGDDDEVDSVDNGKSVLIEVLEAVEVEVGNEVTMFFGLLEVVFC